MASRTQAAPESRAVATPYLSLRNAGAAVEFYEKAFGAIETMRLMQPDGRLGHSEITIEGARIMLADEFPEFGFTSPETLGGSPIHIQLEVPDVDAFVRRAVEAGAILVRPVADQFYGARSGQLRDPFGYTWSVSTHKEALSTEEMQRRIDEMASKPSDAAAAPRLIRAGFRTITPYLTVGQAPELVEFVKRAFGAQELSRSVGGAGGLHVEVKIGDSMVMIGGGLKYSGPSFPAAFHLEVDDVDAVYKSAIEAGATPVREPVDAPYGARGGGVTDLAGNSWYISTVTGPRVGRDPNLIPVSTQSVTSYLHPVRSSVMMDFLRRAFGAETTYIAQSAEGVVHHARLRIGTSSLEMGDANGPYQPRPAMFFLYVPNADAWYHRAVAAGAKSMFEPSAQPYGDRVGAVSDLYGNQWYIATHIGEPAG